MSVNPISVRPSFGSNNTSNSSNSKREVAVAGAGAGAAVVAKDLSTLTKFRNIVTPAAARGVSNHTSEISNVFIRFTSFLEKSKLPGIANVVKSKAVTKGLGWLGSFGAVAITIAELFNTGSVIDKIGDIAAQK